MFIFSLIVILFTDGDRILQSKNKLFALIVNLYDNNYMTWLELGQGPKIKKRESVVFDLRGGSAKTKS